MMKPLFTALIAAGAAMAFSVTAKAETDGEAIYNQACMACHMTGAAGAPIKGDSEAWEPRIEKGIDTLYDHSINGFNAMPPKGGNMSLSDEEVQAAVDFMVKAAE